jgi:hypothetical protein
MTVGTGSEASFATPARVPVRKILSMKRIASAGNFDTGAIVKTIY